MVVWFFNEVVLIKVFLEYERFLEVKNLMVIKGFFKKVLKNFIKVFVFFI